MTKKTTTSSPAREATIALYEKLVATNPRVERKGDTMPYTSVNGNMFSVVSKEGIVCLRLSADQRDAFSAKYKTKPVVMYGALMKEYVAVPPALLEKTKEAAQYFEMSYAYATTLKAKPTTKRTAGKS
ncbi:MAG TPA: hypothetical protein VJN70_03780 [Gemmatimonadaceae bacterium]|nr:hypothetical protein [Gemmatimonadaceae bacterium]